MLKIKFSYATVTPESAEHGDYDDSGFCDLNQSHGIKRTYKYTKSNLDSAAKDIQSIIGYLGRYSFNYSIGDTDTDLDGEPEENYHDDSDTTYSCHIQATGKNGASELEALMRKLGFKTRDEWQVIDEEKRQQRIVENALREAEELKKLSEAGARRTQSELRRILQVLPGGRAL